MQLSSDTIDKIAIDSLKWHYNEVLSDIKTIDHKWDPKEVSYLMIKKHSFEIVLNYYGVSFA